jgi:hypothetical protein
MTFYIYDVETTRVLGRFGGYKTERAAKAGITKLIGTNDHSVIEGVVAIADSVTFVTKIEKQEIRKNLMSGKEFSQPVNTPIYLDPSSETYWSM